MLMSYQFELRHLTYFLMVAQELHFRKAAERLFISQPGLSRQIKQLEDTLEVELFTRDKRNVKLTPAGLYFKKEVAYLFNHLDFSLKQTKLVAQGSIGEIRVGFLGSAMQSVLPKLLLKASTDLPEIKFSLEELSNSAQVEALEKDQLDIGFVRLARVPRGLNLKPVFTDRFSLVLPKNHKLDASSFTGVDQVATEDFILFSSDYSSSYYDQIMSICADKGFTPKVSYKSVHALTIFKLVESGLGIAIVPTSLQLGFALEVKFLEIPNIPQQAVLSACYKINNRNPALEHVLRYL